MPIQFPIRYEHSTSGQSAVLVGNDAELIGELWSITDAELDCLVATANRGAAMVQRHVRLAAKTPSRCTSSTTHTTRRRKQTRSTFTAAPANWIGTTARTRWFSETSSLIWKTRRGGRKNHRHHTLTPARRWVTQTVT